jgi:hypothetical protein
MIQTNPVIPTLKQLVAGCKKLEMLLHRGEANPDFYIKSPDVDIRIQSFRTERSG